jgi:2-isopropylmalate synthase
MGDEVIYDWNTQGSHRNPMRRVALHDETLRDGIQCPSVRDPDIEVKQQVLRHLAHLKVDSCDVGLPGAGPRAVADVTTLVETARDEGLDIALGCAARTHPNDIRPIIEISQRTGVPLEVMTFLGSSPIRMLAEQWDEQRLVELTRTAVRMGVSEGLPVSFVTEDTVRSNPDTLRKVFTVAVEEGADRLVLCDTVGHATPDGVRNLVSWSHELLVELGARDRVRLDWHGHDDRGLSLVNGLIAAQAGCDRVHGTVLGIGERVGNTPLDLMLVNLKLLGAYEHDLAELAELTELVGRECGVPIPVNYPVFGDDAFRTGTGVHAAAVIKAQAQGDDWLADRIYSGVPAGWFGLHQVIEIGHQSGVSNVRYWLQSRGIEPVDSLVDAIFQHAKGTDHTLGEAELMKLVEAHAS